MTTDRSAHQPWQDLDLVVRASAYAAEAHRRDLRKGISIRLRDRRTRNGAGQATISTGVRL